jgi:putative oxidoreductase
MNKFPYLSIHTTLIVLRITTALIFMSHAAVRIWSGTIDRFGDFLTSKGFVAGTAVVWILTVFELAGGLLLMLGVFTRWLAFGFFIIIAVGIIIIHAGNGWFVGEHGTGGMEYSIVLLSALLVVAASDTRTAQLR